SIGFSKMMEENSPWISMSEQGRRWSVALSYELSRYIKEFTGVTDARVFLNENARRTIGSRALTPTASVYVRMAPGFSLNRERAFAMANFVAGAVSGLDVT